MLPVDGLSTSRTTAPPVQFVLAIDTHTRCVRSEGSLRLREDSFWGKHSSTDLDSTSKD